MTEKKDLLEMAENHAQEKGFNLNPNDKIVEVILVGLLRNEAEKGELYCPCRRPSGDKEKDKEIVCPCVFHEDEIKNDGHCHCFLFVK